MTWHPRDTSINMDRSVEGLTKRDWVTTLNIMRGRCRGWRRYSGGGCFIR